MKSGVEFDGDGVITFAQRYLPADAIVGTITNVLPDKVNPDKRIMAFREPKEVPGKVLENCRLGHEKARADISSL